MKTVYAGVDIGGTYTKIGLVMPDGTVLAQTQIPSDIDKGPEALLRRAGDTIRGLMKEQTCKLKGAGIGTAGQVNVAGGILYRAPNMPSWRNVPMSRLLGDQLEIPVVLDNDANVAAWGEFGFGAGKGSRYMLMITLGTGVGGGLVLDGKPYRGARDSGGEVGHIQVEHQGWMCGCGRQGCVEAYVGTRGILRRIQDKLNSGRPSLLALIDRDKRMPVDVSRTAEQGDEVAIEVLQETGAYLGQAIADAVNLFNLERVVVGGGVAKAGDRLLNPARQVVQESALKVAAEVVEIIPAVLGNTAGFVGAAWLAAYEAGDA